MIREQNIIETLREGNRVLREQVAALEKRLSDYDVSYVAVLEEKCAGDELHCACVPHLRQRIAELEAERDALRDSWRFIPCTERLPAQGVRVLIATVFDTVIARYSKEPRQWETDDGNFYHGDRFGLVTGWLPLPEPPADGG